MTVNNKRNTTKTTIVALSTVLLLGIFAATPAFAKACKKVHMEVKNKTGEQIKIVDLDYWDSESEKWRSEPVRNVNINNNRTWQATRNLERVNGQPVYLRVEYKEKKWSRLLQKRVWKAKKSKFYSGTKHCTRNTEFLMEIK